MENLSASPYLSGEVFEFRAGQAAAKILNVFREILAQKELVSF